MKHSGNDEQQQEVKEFLKKSRDKKAIRYLNTSLEEVGLPKYTLEFTLNQEARIPKFTSPITAQDVRKEYIDDVKKFAKDIVKQSKSVIKGMKGPNEKIDLLDTLIIVQTTLYGIRSMVSEFYKNAKDAATDTMKSAKENMESSAKSTGDSLKSIADDFRDVPSQLAEDVKLVTSGEVLKSIADEFRRLAGPEDEVLSSIAEELEKESEAGERMLERAKSISSIPSEHVIINHYSKPSFPGPKQPERLLTFEPTGTASDENLNQYQAKSLEEPRRLDMARLNKVQQARLGVSTAKDILHLLKRVKK
jgi:hypothetical protein